jgi:hypothetical protein
MRRRNLLLRVAESVESVLVISSPFTATGACRGIAQGDEVVRSQCLKKLPEIRPIF